MRLIQHLIRRTQLTAEDGFTMIVAIGALALVTVLTITAFVATRGDIPSFFGNSSQQQAYAAAQAGIQQYLFDLDQNNQFWEQCVPSPANGINQVGSTANRRFAPGSSTESYAIELMPVTGYTSCLTSDPVDSMIQPISSPVSGAIRIRATGFSGKAQRTIVAVLRESTFLDYVWFTQYETDDPIVQTIKAGCTVGNCPGSSWSTVLGKAQTQCAQYWRDNRGKTAFYNSTYCDQIFFINGDNIQGPLHTDDEFAVCGSPTFGRNLNDPIEIGAPLIQGDNGESNEGYGGCTATPTNLGAVAHGAPIYDPPSGNSSLQQAAGLTFTGNTCINLQASTILTAQPPVGSSCESGGLTWTTHQYPASGVIYVQNSSTTPCSLTYNYLAPVYTVNSTGGNANSGCGTAYVHGVYGSSLTIGAQNDIVIDGNTTHQGSNTLLGLVADNFVRVYHPVTGTTDPNSCTANNAAGAISNVTVDAAILSVAHSFIADNYPCGVPLGNLTINGSIAQEFRGGVGQTNSGNPLHGYIKNYIYDDRLRYEEPPHFLNPLQAAWQVVRQNECTPVASGPSANAC
jgi:hypothetical protein